MLTLNKFLFTCIYLSLSWFSSFSFADTDGNFCIGKGYVAVESRGMHIDSEKPSVYIVTVGREGLSERMTVMVPDDDRDRELRCEPDKIVVSNGYLIELVSTGSLNVKRRKIDSEKPFSNTYIPYVRESKVVSIPSDDLIHRYWLVLSAVEQQVSVDNYGVIYHHFSARVVQTNKKHGFFIGSRLLADGIDIETVD